MPDTQRPRRSARYSRPRRLPADCHNIAYTDRDINQLRVEAAGIREILDNSLAPSPRHHRAHAELERLQQIINNHDRSTETP